MIQFLLLAALCADPDIEAMKRSLEAQIGLYQRINNLEQRVTNLEQRGGDPPSVVTAPHDAAGSGIVPDAPVPEPPSTAICQCKGSNRGVCFCLQNRVPCKCNASKGSEWNLVDGRAVSKTGRYADPRQEQTPARAAPVAAAPSRPVVRPAPQMIQLPWAQPSNCPRCQNYRFYRSDDD